MKTTTEIRSWMIEQINAGNSIPAWINGGGSSLISMSVMPSELDTDEFVDHILKDYGEPSIIDKDDERCDDLKNLCDSHNFTWDDFAACLIPRLGDTAENMDMIILTY